MRADRLHPGHAILAALLLAAAVLGWRAGSLATAPFAAPPAFAPPALADRALLSRVDPFFPAVTRTDENLPVTALPYSLHGVRADSATGRGSAIIATGDGQQLVYAVGDALTDGVTLAAIADDHVVIDRGGTREALWIDSGGTEAVQAFDPLTAGSSPPPMDGGTATVPPAAPADPGGSPEPDAIDQAPPRDVAARAGRGIGPDGSGRPDEGDSE